jgi:hypothetical protein
MRADLVGFEGGLLGFRIVIRVVSPVDRLLGLRGGDRLLELRIVIRIRDVSPSPALLGLRAGGGSDLGLLGVRCDLGAGSRLLGLGCGCDLRLLGLGCGCDLRLLVSGHSIEVLSQTSNI